MFKVNGTGSHFWLIEGKLTPLLKWSASPCQKTPCQKTTMTFSGKTFKRPETGHQWFDEFVLSEGETPVVSVATDNGELQIKFKGKNVQHASDASSYNSNGLQLSLPPQGELDEKGHKFIDIAAGEIEVRVFLSEAKKFTSAQDRAGSAHLNVKFLNNIPRDARGLFAELAGIKAMSSGTKALLKRPPEAINLLEAQQKMVCICSPPPPPPPATGTPIPPPSACGWAFAQSELAGEDGNTCESMPAGKKRWAACFECCDSGEAAKDYVGGHHAGNSDCSRDSSRTYIGSSACAPASFCQSTCGCAAGEPCYCSTDDCIDPRKSLSDDSTTRSRTLLLQECRARAQDMHAIKVAQDGHSYSACQAADYAMHEMGMPLDASAEEYFTALRRGASSIERDAILGALHKMIRRRYALQKQVRV
jgi:hypothetical protein